MAFDDLAKMAFGVVQYLYRVGTFCITIGLFLFVVVIFKPSSEFGVIPFRLMLFGFAIESVFIPRWPPRTVGSVLLLASILPTRLYLIAYGYFK